MAKKAEAEQKAFARLVVEKGVGGAHPFSVWLYTDLLDERLEETFLTSYATLKKAQGAARELSERCGRIHIEEKDE